MKRIADFRAIRTLLVALTLVVALAGIALPAAQPASAEPNTKYPIRLSTDPSGAYRGWAACGGDFSVNGSVGGWVIFQFDNFTCRVKDNRADRFQPFVVPSYWNGSTWKVFPGFKDRWCTNRNGAGSTMTCTKSYDPPFEIPGTGSAEVRTQTNPLKDVVITSIMVGLVDRTTGRVVMSKRYIDEWSAAS